jgi:hypothetical protein
MHALNKILIAGVIASMAVISAPAQADRAPSSRTQRARKPQRAKPPARRAKPARTPAQRTASSATLARAASKTGVKSKSHLSKVEKARKKFANWVRNGEDQGSGQTSFHAAFAEIVPANGAVMKETRALEYGGGKQQSQRLSVSGVKNGTFQGHIVGTVSTHDLAHLTWGPYKKAVDKRIAADRIQVSYDYGSGSKRTIVAKGVKSKDATAVPLKIPLNKNGVTRVIYDRTNASGMVVGSSGAYAGRIIELNWNGK